MLEHDPRYTELMGFIDHKVRRKNYRTVHIRKEDVVKKAMTIISDYLVEQIRRENTPED